MDTSGAGRASGISKLFSRGQIADTGQFVGPVDSILDDEDANAITSLAPTDDSLYAQYMWEGERAFKARDYTIAFSRFEMARRIGNDPESLLSMAHVRFATGSYSACAFYLRQVLREVPQLPRVNLRPRAFYGDRQMYLDDLFRLDNEIDRNPGNAETALIKAYFVWFDTDRLDLEAQGARQAIADGLAAPNSPQATQALEMFQESMEFELQERKQEQERKREALNEPVTIRPVAATIP